MLNTVKNLLILSFFLTLLAASSTALAAGKFTVSPLLVDYTTEGRDIITRDITVTNQGDRPVRLYISVHGVSMASDGEILDFVPASMSDRTTSITSWIEISQARIEVPKGEKKVLPLTIRINPNTPPGVYHAVIGFVEGPNRDYVEEKVKSGQSTNVLVKIVIDDKKRESLHLTNFISDRFTFKEDKNELSYTLENTGDLPVSPKGEVIIYDTKGKELASLEINTEGKVINPHEKVRFTEKLPFTNKLGKNKAYLSIEYGKNNVATVFDTTFYYSIPWYYLFSLFAILLLFLFIMIAIFKRLFSSPVDSPGNEVYDLPMFVKNSKEHNEFDHDLNLKRKNDS